MLYWIWMYNIGRKCPRFMCFRVSQIEIQFCPRDDIHFILFKFWGVLCILDLGWSTWCDPELHLHSKPQYSSRVYQYIKSPIYRPKVGQWLVFFTSPTFLVPRTMSQKFELICKHMAKSRKQIHFVPDVCQLRLDFESFSLRGTNAQSELNGGTCLDTFIVTVRCFLNI